MRSRMFATGIVGHRRRDRHTARARDRRAGPTEDVMMRVAFPLVAMMLLGGDAQGSATLPSTAYCDMASLTARVTALNEQCCGGGNSECVCTIDCSSTLRPLLDECRALLDVLPDMDDGLRDGVVGQLDTLHAQCLAIAEPDVHDAGTL